MIYLYSLENYLSNKLLNSLIKISPPPPPLGLQNPIWTQKLIEIIHELNMCVPSSFIWSAPTMLTVLVRKYRYLTLNILFYYFQMAIQGMQCYISCVCRIIIHFYDITNKKNLQTWKIWLFIDKHTRSVCTSVGKLFAL